MRYIMKYTAIYVLLVILSFVSNQARYHFSQHKYGDRNKNIVSKKLTPYVKILNGQTAKKGQFPYAAALFIKGPRCYKYCGGSLISERWILTAAHCVIQLNYTRIRLGSVYSSGNEESTVILISYTAIIHKKYDKITDLHDIALIKLPNDIKFTSLIQPILLPRRRYSKKNLIDSKVITLGWGRTSDGGGGPNKELLYTFLYILPPKNCEEKLPATAFCALGPFNQSTCDGDSGGPVTLMGRNKEILIGITSYGFKACADPTVYTRVDHYLDWIHKHTGIQIKP